MAKISERVDGYVESKRKTWGEPLGKFLGGVIESGLTKYIDGLEPETLAAIKANLILVRDRKTTPKEVKDLIDRTLIPGNPLVVIIGVIFIVAQIVQVITTIWQPGNKQLSYVEEQAAKTYRFDPLTAMQLWLRDPAVYDKYMADLRDLGVSDERILAFKELSQVIPQAQDIIRFALREVYSPEIAEKYGQFQDIPTDAYVDAAKAGLPKDTFDKFWAAHWYLPSSGEGFEMLHRGILTEDELKGLLKANDIMPYWRDKLMAISWNVPTRVDVRRFWDMRTIDEARLREIYTAIGYHGKDLEDYVLWTKIYVDFPTLLARYKNGWIALEDVKRELVAMGMKAEQADIMIEEKIKKEAPERTATEKDLTKTDVINGVKKGVITRVQGAELLLDLGYDSDEATYLLAVNIPLDETDKAVKERELTKGDIAAAVKGELITPEDAISKLIALRYKQVDAEFLASIYAAQIPIEAVEPERELTKGDIASALKAGIISGPEAKIMLTDLRYSSDDADLLVNTNTPEPAVVKVEEARQVDKGDIISAYKADIITSNAAISRLGLLGYTSVDATFIVELYDKLEALKPITKPKEASKADITTAVKKGLITPEEGYTMLISLGFAPDAATFILSLTAESSPFSPMNYEEFKDVTQKYRAATGKGGVPMTEELKKAADELVKVTHDVKLLKRAVKDEEAKLTLPGPLPAEATKELHSLQAKMYRAEAELVRVKNDYERQVAAWRYSTQ